jgi:hypothetical protein
MFLLSYCSGLLPEARAEEPGSIGDADLTLVTADGLRAVLELKFAKSEEGSELEVALDKLARLGLQTIEEKEYGEIYLLKVYDFATLVVWVIGRGRVKAIFGDPVKSTI